MSDITRALADLTDRVIAVRVLVQRGDLATKDPRMSITGLQSGAFKDMLADMRKEIADAQSAGVADVKAATVQARGQITAAVSSVKEKVKSEVASALHEFAQFTNGEPAETEETKVETEAEPPTANSLPKVELNEAGVLPEKT